MCLTVEKVDGVTGLPSAAPKMGPRENILEPRGKKCNRGTSAEYIYGTVYDEYQQVSGKLLEFSHAMPTRPT